MIVIGITVSDIAVRYTVDELDHDRQFGVVYSNSSAASRQLQST